MSDINFNGYSDEEFFKLFLDAVKETYGEYCTFKEREEDLSGYSEPVFEKSIEEAEQRITSIMKIIPKVTNEAAQHKITADYAKRHLEQCETALSNEQDKREVVEQQLAKANERADKAERAEKIATLAAQDMNLEKSIALEKVQKLEKTLGNCADGLAKANERVAKLECENTNGNAAAELLIWWAQKLSNAPNEDLKEVIRIGYKRIVNLANLIGEEQLRKEQEGE